MTNVFSDDAIFIKQVSYSLVQGFIDASTSGFSASLEATIGSAGLPTGGWTDGGATAGGSLSNQARFATSYNAIGAYSNLFFEYNQYGGVYSIYQPYKLKYSDGSWADLLPLFKMGNYYLLCQSVYGDNKFWLMPFRKDSNILNDTDRATADYLQEGADITAISCPFDSDGYTTINQANALKLDNSRFLMLPNTYRDGAHRVTTTSLSVASVTSPKIHSIQTTVLNLADISVSGYFAYSLVPNACVDLGSSDKICGITMNYQPTLSGDFNPYCLNILFNPTTQEITHKAHQSVFDSGTYSMLPSISPSYALNGISDFADVFSMSNQPYIDSGVYSTIHDHVLGGEHFNGLIKTQIDRYIDYDLGVVVAGKYGFSSYDTTETFGTDKREVFGTWTASSWTQINFETTINAAFSSIGITNTATPSEGWDNYLTMFFI